MPTRTDRTPCAEGSGSGLSDLPSGSTSIGFCESVSAKPVIGRASTQAREPTRCGRRLATMTRVTPRGMTAQASVKSARPVSAIPCRGWR